jgi:hypothetical protein
MSTILKPYAVEVSFTMIVMAEHEAHAQIIADSKYREAVHDEPNPDLDVSGPITDVSQLTGGWTGNCVPYGGDGETELADIIAALPPPRDTKTIDMFEEQTA